MKDNTISYDLVHHPQHSWTHQRQQQHQQQQPHQHQHQHQQTHSPNVYTSQHGSQPPGSQTRSIATHHQQQQNQQHGSQLDQYSHQQLQSAASAYYQQAHLYPSFQDQQQPQQQAGPEHHHHHHGSGPSVTASGQPRSAHAAAVAAQHVAVHNQQASNTQASTLNHAVWSPGVGALTPQAAHHAVVTDHSTLAYMTHAYQNHNSPVNDHRNSSGPMANQPIGSGSQPPSYAVDSLYNSSAVAAAAYGYNNYNAAFFQTSSNGPHTQTGHPSQTNLSAFWDHNQSSQQRNAHSQTVAQTSLQQRQQQMAPDQATSYLHDPRLYYGRPPYGQVMQNFGQHQTQSTQQQSEIPQNRISTLSQQSLVQHQDHQLQDFEGHQSQQMQLGGQQQSSTTTNTSAQANLSQNSSIDNQLSSNQIAASPQAPAARKLHSPKLSPQHPTQKQSATKSEKAPLLVKDHSEHDQITGSKIAHVSVSNQVESQQLSVKDQDTTIPPNKQANVIKDNVQQNSVSSLSSAQATQPVIKNDSAGQYQGKKQSTTGSPQVQGRNVYRPPQDDRNKHQSIEPTKKIAGERDMRPSIATEVKKQPSSSNSKQHDSEQSHQIEDSLATLSLSSRKTTWASIASQPAKVAQPKSLKSKIAGSNSVLSSAKHLASSVTLDSSSLDSKNGINPAIKNSVSAAATSTQRGSIPPPISKVAPAPSASLKLDLLGEDNTESSKISWPAVNASINLTLDDPPLPKASVYSSSMSSSTHTDKVKSELDGRRERDTSNRDYNHNQGVNAKMVNNYQHAQPYRDDRREDRRDDRREDRREDRRDDRREDRREDRRDDFWTHRRDQRDQRDYRVRRDSDRKEMEPEKRLIDDPRNQINSRRDFKPPARVNHFREEESTYRDQKRGAMTDRNDHRGNDNYRYVPNRYDSPRDSHHSNHAPVNNNRNIESAPLHHYNNLRDGNSTRKSQGKFDISLHPHLNPTNYNPKNFDCEPENARYFIIKSYSEDDIHRSIKYSIWCSTNHGNKRLDEAYRQQQAKNGQLFLFFSVNGSGHFCGMAQMTSAVDFDSSSGVWAQSKWQGEFSVKWIYVKDVPNGALRHITLENNEDKPVTNSRDTQEVPSEKGKSVLSIIHQFPHNSSLFDNFLHYERRQEEERNEKMKKSHPDQHHVAGRPDDRGTGSRYNRPYTNPRIHNDMRDHPGNRDRPSRYVS